MIIDEDIERIKELIKKHNYEKVYFSRDKNQNILGMSLFKIGLDVREYITEKIYSLEDL